MGLDGSVEYEDSTRSSLALPGVQNQLLTALIATGDFFFAPLPCFKFVADLILTVHSCFNALHVFIFIIKLQVPRLCLC